MTKNVTGDPRNKYGSATRTRPGHILVPLEHRNVKYNGNSEYRVGKAAQRGHNHRRTVLDRLRKVKSRAIRVSCLCQSQIPISFLLPDSTIHERTHMEIITFFYSCTLLRLFSAQ